MMGILRAALSPVLFASGSAEGHAARGPACLRWSGGWGAVRRWFSASEGDWARPVVATVLVLLLLGVPHQRLIDWLSDSLLVEHWKEIVFAVGCLAYVSVVVRRRGLTRTELRGVLLATPFVIAVLVRLVVGVVRHEDGYLLFMGGANLLYYIPAFLLAIYLVDSSYRSPSRQVERTLHWVLLATTLAAVLSILDNFFHISGYFDFFGRTRVEARLDYNPAVWRSSATFQSPMVLGMISGTGFLLCLYYFVTRLQDRPRALRRLAAFGALMLLHLMGLYLTFSRGPLVATAVGSVIIALFGSKALDWRSIAASRRKIVSGIVGAGLVLAVMILLLPDPLQQHLASIFDWSGDQNNSTRLRRMTMGLESFRDAPWIGHGVGSAQGPLADYRILVLGQDRFFTNPESQLLTWAMEGGVMFLIPAFLIVGFMIHTAVRMASWPDRYDLRRLGVLFLALQAALYAEGLIMPILNNHTFQLGFWVLFGALVSFQRELKEPGRAYLPARGRDGIAWLAGRAMTILITLENPEGSGAPRMALQYAGALVSAGHRVLAVCGPPSQGASSILPDLEQAGVEVRRVRSFSPRTAITVLRRLRDLIRGENIDCVVGFQQRDRVLACLIARLAGAPCVISAQSQHVFRGGLLERRMKERIYGWAVRGRADLVICASEVVEEELRRRFAIDGERTTVLPNGIDVQAFPTFGLEEARTVRRSLGVSDGELLVLNVGRIDPQKGQDLLLDAFRTVAERHSHVRLAIAGSVGRSSAASEARKYQDRLRSVVLAAGLEKRVLFLGWREDVPALLAAADLYVQPSRWEGWPVAVVEAMAAGLPVVSSDCSGRPRGFVDGEHGWIVPTGDVPALEEALERVLATDVRELRRMGASARCLAERHYDVGRLGERFVQMVEGVLAL